MTAANRTPTTRILTLAAIILAAGVLSFRALDLFAAPGLTPQGSAIEQKAISLLEPLVGAGDVRVSITGGETRRTLILVNGPANAPIDSLQADIEALFEASYGPISGNDVLTIKQFPFASGTGSTLSPLQMAEFTGLSLLCMTLLAILMLQSRSDAPTLKTPERTARPEASPRQMQSAQPPEISPEIQSAAHLAEQNPDQTIHILRRWMTNSEDAA